MTNAGETTEKETLLKVKDLKLSFRIQKKLVPTIRNVSYTLRRGEVLGIVGESGSGKTTLLKKIFEYYNKRKVVLLCSVDQIESGNRARVIKNIGKSFLLIIRI